MRERELEEKIKELKRGEQKEASLYQSRDMKGQRNSQLEKSRKVSFMKKKMKKLEGVFSRQVDELNGEIDFLRNKYQEEKLKVKQVIDAHANKIDSQIDLLAQKNRDLVLESVTLREKYQSLQ